MPWEYHVRIARFFWNGEFQFEANYAGARGFYNNPDLECVKNKGRFHVEDTELSPLVIQRKQGNLLYP